MDKMTEKEVKFWYVTNEEHNEIKKFYQYHKHREIFGIISVAISDVPYHIEIKPNSVSYGVTVICDICKKKKFKKLRRIKWFKDVTDYDSW